ncbi:hypothetical protein GCM10011348_47260 [Marinobacterium nitratireducens]|uniref:DUF1329 domain-containing protein n=1 Tax=Marinobacterium nitratireducens TaxID=518897 RepID=A0A918DYS9_9GAMM|nr:DUF1329 domain-containing protein [Marinobacterium nitratireducens]GGO89457.1 hypothetical protein GCM10011348_47260 [Marinobacterium nitratireducens]
MKFRKSIMPFALTALTVASSHALAFVSTEDAARLGNELTPVGAERAGNADGSIPEWTGGMTKAPAGYVPGGPRIDPFADEKPLFVIDASNYKEYGDRLTVGQKALFEKYPDTFRMPVYPSHRTAAAPQFVYDQTRANATRAELISGGDGVANAYGGYPFPIPQNGHEAIWNHLLRWLGEGAFKKYQYLTVYPNGDRSVGAGDLWETYPYYNSKGSLDSFGGDTFHLMLEYSLPVRRKGEVILVRDPVNAASSPRQAWQYIPGQRRVRRAPTIAYDTPHVQFAGQTTYDDSFMYNGAPDRFDWKLVGKKEMYIPYNNNGMLVAAKKGDDEIKAIATPRHPNPDYARWELHRVWVVEATLKEGTRHVYGKRTFYLDEDSWAAVATDIYDGRGEIWRAGFASLLNAYDQPVTVIRGYWHADLQNDTYAFNELDIEPIKFYEGEDDGFYSPSTVRQMSRR